ncbi:MAG: hypothetical protein HYV90_03225 [Candidatus Woesebacteria bacterium]|nr:MAG: hypothetical protein HYV90_03225 [Candidatus Woesebacteria bacterium]
MESTDDMVEEYLNQPPVDRELSIRSIRLNESTVDSGFVEIPVLPQRPAVKPGEEDAFLLNTKKTLRDLNISETETVSTEVITIGFQENIPDEVRGPDRSGEQSLKIYSFLSPEKVSKEGLKDGVPLVIFSHGGKIHSEVIASSGYLPMLYEDNPDMILIAMDHRGSQSHKAKEDYGLDDRVADILIALKYTQDNLVKEYADKGIKWNGNIIIIGDSMGGEVATVVAEKVGADGLVLTEPAAYSVFAHHVKFGQKSEQEPVFGGEKGVIKTKSPEDSYAFDSIKKYANEPNSKILMIKMKNDKIVGSVPDKYIESINETDPQKIEVLEVEGGHGSTTPEEVRKISGFVKSLKGKK